MRKKFFCVLIALIAIFTLVSCETAPAAPACEHSFNEETITTPTATEPGVKELTCELCGVKETVVYEFVDYLVSKARISMDHLQYSIKADLLNPSSYTENHTWMTLFHDEKNERYFLVLDIDYSAQNKMGGYSRKQERTWYGWNGYFWQEKIADGVSYGSDEYYDIATDLMRLNFGTRAGVKSIYSGN